VRSLYWVGLGTILVCEPGIVLLHLLTSGRKTACGSQRVAGSSRGFGGAAVMIFPAAMQPVRRTSLADGRNLKARGKIQRGIHVHFVASASKR
jgi:hypothetical protein